MIERLVRWCLENRALVLLATLLIAVAGVQAIIHTPVDAIPDLSENQVIVLSDWAGRSAQEVEDQITYPLSTSLQGLPGVKELLTLADGAALRPKEAKAIIDSVRAAIGDWPEFAAKAGVSEASVKRIGSSFVSLG